MNTPENLFDNHSPLEMAESLEQLLYGWLYYASETGLSSNETLKPYETGRALINQLLLISTLEITQNQTAA